MNKKGFLKKIILLIFFMFMTIYLIKRYEYQIMDFLQESPVLWSIFQHMRTQIDEKTLLGLGYLSFAANLLLLMFPIEAAAAYYFSLDYSFGLVMGVLLIGTIAGQFFNWLLGLVLGRHVMRLFFRKSLEKWEMHSQKWGSWMLALFSLLPFTPLDTICLFLGSTKYNLKNLIVILVVTTIIKYTLIFYFAGWFENFITTDLSSKAPFLANYLG